MRGLERLLSGLRSARSTRATRRRRTSRRCAGSGPRRCIGAASRRYNPRSPRLTRAAPMHAFRPPARAHRVLARRRRRAYRERLRRGRQAAARRAHRCDARGCGMPAVALTDQGNLFALVKFYRAAQARGVKPMVGVDALVREDGERARAQPARAAVPGRARLPQPDAARQRAATSKGRAGTARRLTGRGSTPTATAGLIALSGGARGRRRPRARRRPRRRGAHRCSRPGSRCSATATTSSCSAPGAPARKSASPVALRSRRGARRAGGRDQRRALPRARTTSRRTRRASASTRARCSPIRPAPRRYSDAAVPALAAGDGASCSPTCPRRSTTPSRSRDRCNLELQAGQVRRCRRIPVPAGTTVEQEYLRDEARRGPRRRAWRRSSADSATQADRREAYAARLEAELDVICQMGFAGYFLIVADFIRWARENGVPVGPGRGSGAGSLVAYALRHHRSRSAALRPAVRALPESRARLDARLRRRLLHGRPRPRDRLRGRALRPRARLADHHLRHAWRPRPWCATWRACSGMPYGFADRIAKLIPFELGITLDDALEQGRRARAGATRSRTRCARSSTWPARSRA